jgi:hypothetical protein
MVILVTGEIKPSTPPVKSNQVASTVFGGHEGDSTSANPAIMSLLRADPVSGPYGIAFSGTAAGSAICLRNLRFRAQEGG